MQATTRFGVGAKVVLLAGALIWPGCGASTKVDPRCKVEAEWPHRGQVAKSINGSKLWREYFNRVSPSAGSQLVEFKFQVERKTRKSYSGDYDPGTISVDFRATSLRNGKLLHKEEMRVNLQEFMIGLFDKDASREEIQEIAFKATEKKVYPYLDRWIQIAAIRAMGNEGSAGSAFAKTLKHLIDDKWTAGEMRGAAEEALRSIGGTA